MQRKIIDIMKLQMLEFFWNIFKFWNNHNNSQISKTIFFENMKSMFVNEFLLNISLTNYIVRTRKMK